MTAHPTGRTYGGRLLPSRDWLVGKKSLDVGGQLGGRAVTGAHRACHGLETNRLERPGNRRIEFSRLAKVLLLNADQKVAQVVAPDRHATGQQRVERRAQAVDVRGRLNRVLPAERLLWAHIRRRPSDRS